MPRSSLPSDQSGNAFSGEIVVASRIVDYLSSGLYESPAACLKELINNSYDADATLVKVFVQPDADRIIIDDNGDGMDRRDFERNFRRISETFKREKSDTTDHLGRPKIGKIGIGFISANEICDVMELHSTKKGSSELIVVRINFRAMRMSLADRRRSGSDFAKGDYEGEVLSAPTTEHYTRIFLTQVRGGAKRILAGAAAVSGYSGHGYSLYGKSAESVEQDLALLPITDWTDFDPYSETMLRIGLNVPVAYHDHWLPPPLQNQAAAITNEVRRLRFRVSYDGSDLRKPIVFNPEQGQRSFFYRFSFTGKEVSAHGYFYAQHGTLRPQDLNGILIRIRQAAVGRYDSTFMGFPTSAGPLFQRWISAEVWASDELEDALNIDRKTLRVSHPAYVELQAAIHEELSRVLSRARKELYQEASAGKRRKKALATLKELRSVAGEADLAVGKGAGRTLRDAWPATVASIESDRRILATYSVPQLYKVV